MNNTKNSSHFSALLNRHTQSQLNNDLQCKILHWDCSSCNGTVVLSDKKKTDVFMNDYSHFFSFIKVKINIKAMNIDHFSIIALKYGTNFLSNGILCWILELVCEVSDRQKLFSD